LQPPHGEQLRQHREPAQWTGRQGQRPRHHAGTPGSLLRNRAGPLCRLRSHALAAGSVEDDIEQRFGHRLARCRCQGGQACWAWWGAPIKKTARSCPRGAESRLTKKPVGVQVEGHAGRRWLAQRMEFGLVVHRCQVAPLVEYMDLAASAGCVVLPDADPAGVWPGLQRCAASAVQARRVQGRAFTQHRPLHWPIWCAKQLLPDSNPRAWGHNPMGLCSTAQLLGVPLGAVHAVQLGQAVVDHVIAGAPIPAGPRPRYFASCRASRPRWRRNWRLSRCKSLTNRDSSGQRGFAAVSRQLQPAGLVGCASPAPPGWPLESPPSPAAARLDVFADVQGQCALAVEEVHARPGIWVCRARSPSPATAATHWRCPAATAPLVPRPRSRARPGPHQPLQHHIDITHRAVARLGVQAVAAQDRIQPVALVLGVQPAREANGTQRLGFECYIQSRQFVGDEAVVKPHVVGYRIRRLPATPAVAWKPGQRWAHLPPWRR